MMADLGANAIGRELQPSLSYDPMRAFTPICHLVNLPIVLIVKAGLPVDDLAGLIAHATAAPHMVYAHPGIGHASHLAQELILRRTDVQMTPVPYRSGAEVMRSLLQRDRERLPTVSTALPFIRDKVEALAVAAPGPVSCCRGAAGGERRPSRVSRPMSGTASSARPACRRPITARPIASSTPYAACPNSAGRWKTPRRRGGRRHARGIRPPSSRPNTHAGCR